jgi:hypothetical protein
MNTNAGTRAKWTRRSAVTFYLVNNRTDVKIATNCRCRLLISLHSRGGILAFQLSGRISIPSRSCSQAVCKTVWHMPLLCVQWITPVDGQRNSPKHVEFHFENKFEKLVHPVGFIIRKICQHARSHERKKWKILAFDKLVLKKVIIFTTTQLQERLSSCYSLL